MARVKLELRRGLLFGPRLQTLACNALGFYLYIVARKPFGSDCVALAENLVALDFGVSDRTIRKWLEALAVERLAWHHRARGALCVHILKAGDHSGNDWVPAMTTHADRKKTSGCDRPESSGQGGADRPESSGPTGPKVPVTGGPSTKPQNRTTPENLSPGAAAPRTPDGMRGGAPAEPDIPCPPDVWAEIHGLGRKVRAES